MSDGSVNPYESPQAEAGTVPLPDRVLTEDMLFYLKGASPWLRFIGIVGFIGLGLAVVLILIMGFGLSSALANTEELGAFAALGPGLTIIYIPFLALYFFPLFFMFRFGNKIKSYLHSGNSEDLEEAFKNNKSLWTFAGVLTIISLAFMALALLIGIIVGIAAAVGAFS